MFKPNMVGLTTNLVDEGVIDNDKKILNCHLWKGNSCWNNRISCRIELFDDWTGLLRRGK